MDSASTAQRVRARLVAQGLSAEQLATEDVAEHLRVANSEIVRSPLLVAKCRDTADVLAVIRVAIEAGVPVAASGGGYSPAGLGTIDDGIVVDLAAFDRIDIDKDRRRARVGAGVLAGDLERALDAHGLAMTLPVPSRAGVAGAALLGGVGVLVRKLGYICDAIVGATIVTGEAEVLQVDADAPSDLLWGLKGGGGNFGIVTELEFDCVAQGPLTTTQLVFARESFASALSFYRTWTNDLPDDITAVLMIRPIPPFPGMAAEHVGSPGLLVFVVHADPDAAAADLASLTDAPHPIYSRTFTGSPLELRDAMERGFPMARFGAIIRSGWALDIDETDIEAIVALADTIPSPHSIIEVVRMRGGVSSHADAGCAPGRDMEFLLNAMALWVEPADAPACREWSAAGARVIHAIADGPALVPGFASEDELGQAATTYGAHYERLRDLKTRFDPRNTFARNLNIQPRSTR